MADIRDLLPAPLISLIRDRYVAAVADAEAAYDLSEEDEDALTGALGHAISTPRDFLFRDERGIEYHVRISYKKIRGRGPDAPEKTLGADGIFQIEIDTSEGTIFRKGLPFQSKKKWTGKNSDLLDQARTMAAASDSGIVVDYSPHGYKAALAVEVISAGGNRRNLDQSRKMKPLGQLLGNDFLDCTAGKQGLFYDPDSGEFVVVDTGPGLATITTTIKVGYPRS